MIRSSSNGELMVLIQFFENQPENIDLLLNHLKTPFLKLHRCSMSLIKRE
jgi:23S rRNA (uracil1939-C5)-methyltransferase